MSTKGDKCGNYQKCEPYAKVTKAKAVGKGYGDASEANLMKNLIHGGAVAAEMKFPSMLGSYKKGIVTKEKL